VGARNTGEDARGRKRPFSKLHVGTFTSGGTFRSAVEKLDHIAATGLTAIRLMPVADFAGRRNWATTGVLLYAPDSAYGRPDDLKTLIDEAHLRGLMVFLDVVYNHFGPEGNYLSRYAPAFSASAHTPWGNAIDVPRPQVRAFAIDNALHWLCNYRIDGLRLDAVHAIVEPGKPSILYELSRSVGALASATGRMIHLVLENDGNQATLLDPWRNRRKASTGRMERRLSSCLAPTAHRRRAGLTIRTMHAIRAATSRASCRAGFAYQGEPPPHRDEPASRRTLRRACALGLREFPAEP